MNLKEYKKSILNITNTRNIRVEYENQIKETFKEYDKFFITNLFNPPVDTSKVIYSFNSSSKLINIKLKSNPKEILLQVKFYQQSQSSPFSDIIIEVPKILLNNQTDSNKFLIISESIEYILINKSDILLNLNNVYFHIYKKYQNLKLLKNNIQSTLMELAENLRVEIYKAFYNNILNKNFNFKEKLDLPCTDFSGFVLTESKTPYPNITDCRLNLLKDNKFTLILTNSLKQEYKINFNVDHINEVETGHKIFTNFKLSSKGEFKNLYSLFK